MSYLITIRPLALIIALALATHNVAADDKPNPMFEMFQHHYVQRTEFFRSENSAMQTVVLLGDSITEGFNVSKWFPFRRVLNRGIGADTIGLAPIEKDKRGVLRRLDCSVFDCSTSHVFLMIGINDLGDSRTITELSDGYRRILQTIHEKAPLITVHVQSLLPTRGNFARHNEPVRQLNEQLRKLAEEFKYPFVNLHPLFCDSKGELREELTRDGLHITNAGYAIWKQEIDRVMAW
ncbi:MAG: GDSL-type esterase/lipase family protein [Candidatus Sumerlaeaceae bacterium]